MAVPLLQVFVCASLILYVAFVVSLFSLTSLPLVPRKGLWSFLEIFTYVFVFRDCISICTIVWEHSACRLFILWLLCCICLLFPLVFGTRCGSNCISSCVLFIYFWYVLSTKKTASFVIHNAPSEDSDQTAQKRMLIWIFAGRIWLTVRFLT